ncbi:hypothetical protein SMD44_p20048 (plasmid) [Streptomyces alboflavus]|uniref:Uncharacterized protein n=1 Tax=Streptomyces alboflavus TaxID=67267 RepID=A0A291W5C7_9ACTN|nr:hypothetical protein [Streptomyces alboflavus]ATM24831.1 hypothetical protein SMD44_p20048 [Streptomyces alboflavus]
MNTSTALTPLTGTNPARQRRAAPYENWRPPIIGVSLLVPIGADSLVVADLLGGIMIPTGSVHDSQTPEQAALNVLQGPEDGLPLLRRVALAWVQMRRRKVITHVLATAPMTRGEAERLAYHDPRAAVRVLPTMRIVDELPEPGRLRFLVGLQSLATGETAHIEGDVVRPCSPPDLFDFPRTSQPRARK